MEFVKYIEKCFGTIIDDKDVGISCSIITNTYEYSTKGKIFDKELEKKVS